MNYANAIVNTNEILAPQGWQLFNYNTDSIYFHRPYCELDEIRIIFNSPKSINLTIPIENSRFSYTCKFHSFRDVITYLSSYTF